MSELKSESIHDMYWGSACGVDTNRKVYLKSEADKVIAEKDKEIAELKEQVQEERSAKVNYKISANDLSEGLKEAYEEIKHQKYKRCLDKAKWCYAMDCRMLDEASDNGTFFKESWCWKRAVWYGKWKRKWLELAEKFKEEK